MVPGRKWFISSPFFQDNVILALKEWGVAEEDYVPSDEDDPFLVVHPNVVVDDL